MESNSFDLQGRAVCVKLPITHSHWANWAKGAPPVVGAGGKSSFELLLRFQLGSAAPRRWGGCRMLPGRTSPLAAALAPVRPRKSGQCFLLWGAAGCWCLTQVGNCLCCHPSLGDCPCCLPRWGCGCLLASPSLPGLAAHVRCGWGWGGGSLQPARVGAAQASPRLWSCASRRAKGRGLGAQPGACSAAAPSPASWHRRNMGRPPEPPKYPSYPIATRWPFISPAERTLCPPRTLGMQRRSCSRAFYLPAPRAAHALFTARLPGTTPHAELFMSPVGFFHGSLIRVS